MKEYKWCAIDAEGDVGDKGLLGVAFYADNMACYETDHDGIRELLVSQANEGYTFLAHNAQYDLSVIFWQLNIPMRAVYYNGRFNRGEWRYNRKKPMCQLWDTFALSGGISLAELGNAIGYPKYPTPQRLLGIDPDKYKWRCSNHNKWECEECYAIRDSEIVYRFMVDFNSTLSGWGIKPHRRLSGLAIETWKGLDNPQPIALDDARIKKLARRAYYGGRVECFKLGHIGPVHKADVRSMYPHVMRSTPYPDPRQMVYCTLPSVSSVQWGREGAAEVDISIPAAYIPPLPCIHKGDRLYPYGRLRGCWTLLELRHALSLGATINRVYQLAYSLNNLYPFEQFIGTLWELRQAYAAKGDPRALHAKLLMNNLYGRIGMREKLVREDVWPARLDMSLKKQEHDDYEVANGDLLLKLQKEEKYGSQWTNVLWAAQTTGAARVLLHKHLLAQGQGILYCDTDSVFSTTPIVGLGVELGELKDEGILEEMIFSLPKLYAEKVYAHDMPESWHTEPCEKHHQRKCDDCRWKGKAKGVPRSVALEFLRNGEASFKQPIKPRESMHRRIKAGTWIDVHKEQHNVPLRRQPANISAMSNDYGFSDTVPPAVGPLP